MTRAQTLALLVVAGAMSIACEDGAPTDPVTGPSLAQGGSNLPFKEAYSTSGTIAPSPSCPAGTFLVSLTGGGTATHVGRYTIANSHCLDLTTGAFTNGVFVKTAPNGDRLLGGYAGSGSILVAPAPPDLVGRFAVSGTLVFTGGTGRYADASGTVDMQGIQVTDFSAAPWPTQVDLDMKGTFSW